MDNIYLAITVTKYKMCYYGANTECLNQTSLPKVFTFYPFTKIHA